MGRATKGFTDGERAEWLRTARLIDDGFMRACLANAPECVEAIAGAAMGAEVAIEDYQSQADAKSLAGRSLELDFLMRDAQGRRYNVEVDSAASSFPPRRARYHASALDSLSLAPGQDFGELPDAAVIAMCEGDQMGAGRLRTEVRRCSTEDGSPFHDGSAIIYVNCAAADGTPLGRVAHDMLCADPDDMLVPELAERVRAFKGKGAAMGRPTYANEMEQLLADRNYDAGMEQGMQRGMERGMQRGIEQGMERGLRRAADAIAALEGQLRASGVPEAEIAAALEAGRKALAG